MKAIAIAHNLQISFELKSFLNTPSLTQTNANATSKNPKGKTPAQRDVITDADAMTPINTVRTIVFFLSRQDKSRQYKQIISITKAAATQCCEDHMQPFSVGQKPSTVKFGESADFMPCGNSSKYAESLQEKYKKCMTSYHTEKQE